MKWLVLPLTLLLAACADPYTKSLRQMNAATQAQQEANAKLQQQYCGSSTETCPQVYRLEAVVDAKVGAQYDPQDAALYAAGAIYQLAGADETSYCTRLIINYDLISGDIAESDDNDVGSLSSSVDSDSSLDVDPDITIEGPKEIARLKADEVWVKSHPVQMREVYGNGFQAVVRNETNQDEQEIVSTQSAIDKCVSAKSKLAYANDELQRISDETMRLQFQKEQEREEAVTGLLNQLTDAFQQQADEKLQNAEMESESFRQDQELGHEQQEEFEQQQQEHSNAEATQEKINERQQQMQDFLYGCFAQMSAPSGCPSPGVSGFGKSAPASLIPPAGYYPGKHVTKPAASTTGSNPPPSDQL